MRTEGKREIPNCNSSLCTNHSDFVSGLTLRVKESEEIASLFMGGEMQYPRRQRGVQRSSGCCWKLPVGIAQKIQQQDLQGAGKESVLIVPFLRHAGHLTEHVVSILDGADPRLWWGPAEEHVESC